MNLAISPPSGDGLLSLAAWIHSWEITALGSPGWCPMSMLGLSGCALGTAVQPWEKETLARPEMTFEGDKLDNAFTEHIYSSKEGASGGAGVGGGGCGCN